MRILKSVMLGIVACAGLAACTGEGSVDRYDSRIAGLQDECDQILVDMADAESDASQDALEEAYRECLENHVANHGGDERCDEDDARRCEAILDGIKDTLNDEDRAPTCGDHADTDVCSLMDAYRVCLMDDGDEPLHCERVRDEAADCRGDDDVRTADQALEEDRPDGEGDGEGEGDADERPEEGDDRPESDRPDDERPDDDAPKCERIKDEFPECFGDGRPDDGDDRPDEGGDDRPDEGGDDPDENPDEPNDNPDEHPDEPNDNPDEGPSAEQCEAIIHELMEVIEECSQDGPESAQICENKIKQEAPACFE